jgi:hypothetical protein
MLLVRQVGRKCGDFLHLLEVLGAFALSRATAGAGIATLAATAFALDPGAALADRVMLAHADITC